MRGGGIVFGPVVRDHAHDLTKKVRKLALKTALSAKQADGKLVVLESTQMKEPKTRDLVKTLEKLGWTSALIIDGTEVDANFAKAARNILALDVLPSQGANVHDILRRETLVLTKDAVANLVERLK
jgi:large subunit ribosomal protein L4